ncbi:MAG TPA: AhpC/TSA family protein [Porphyromonadaceae bacterium]|nr:AhpC/TSA family protein [Porphyromonadaceae bacterium]HCM19842.1 AhpC/TSA family protein [Porphyromonadaceae bacterium]
MPIFAPYKYKKVKMKRTVFFLTVMALLFSCQQGKNYTVKGKVADPAYEGKNVYVQAISGDEMVTVDTLTITDNAFTLKGEADTTVLRFIALDETVNPEKPSRIPVLVEPGTIEINFDSVITVKGTAVNNAYNDFRLHQRDLTTEIRSVVDQYNKAHSEGTITDALEKEINVAYDRISGEIDSLNFHFVKENIKNDLGQYLFMASASMFSPEKQKEILALTDDEFKANANIQRIVERLENYENVAVGKKFVDFTLKDPQGKDVSLSDYAGKGKVVLVDFWASWCGPCRDEMPNVVEAYKKYKNKDFEVVGVSLDQEHEKWVKGIQDLQITWPQMSDLNYWDSPVVNLYAINGIPHTVLIGKDGTIIEKDLRGEELHKKLDELLAQ